MLRQGLKYQKQSFDYLEFLRFVASGVIADVKQIDRNVIDSKYFKNRHTLYDLNNKQFHHYSHRPSSRELFG